jgi:DNA-dependent RNA polymerase auxiliary subunit epsilon
MSNNSKQVNHISARITGVKYTPFLCRKLNTFEYQSLKTALSSEATFILKVNEDNKIAVSWWVSAKRTRSYPFTRVYDSLSFIGKKVTVIPIVKDEGFEGDRDFLQWDTVSLMSLLGVYVIIGYYVDAEKNSQYANKITNQRYDIQYIESQIQDLVSYQSDALHWNLSQLEKAGEIGEKSINAYHKISDKLKVKMHSLDSARERFKKLEQGKDAFLNLSRGLAEQAQKRESVTVQPKEMLDTGDKATLTITNYLGGEYFLTCDEAKIHDNIIHLIEGKHTVGRRFPSLNDVKDGLLKMILLTNIEDVKVGDKEFKSIPILKLTTTNSKQELPNHEEREHFNLLKKASEKNGFKVLINGHFL